MESVLGKECILQNIDERKILTICQKFSLGHTLASLLCNKNIEIPEIPFFLNPTIKQLMPDPLKLDEMDKAVKTVAAAVINKTKITIYGDYDVDGATSVAILLRYFENLGRSDVSFYIPDRFEEGYGVNEKAILKIHKTNTKIIIMVDCGTTSHDCIELCNRLGMQSVIFDHHACDKNNPNASAFVNPHSLKQRLGLEGNEKYMKSLCSVGIVFLFLVALQRELSNLNFFNNSLVAPDLMDFLDLVSLGTVCDVMPLTGLNRAFVKRGLEKIATRKNLGIRHLIDSAGIREKVSSYHMGFIIGPMINAGGRIGSSRTAAELLSTNDEIKARELSYELLQFNSQRKTIEKNMTKEAIEQNEKNSPNEPIVLVVCKNFNKGLVGIVASRMKDMFGKPAFIGCIDEENTITGSCRSVDGINIGAIIKEALDKDILIKGGGHEMAGGFTLELEKLSEFQVFLKNKTENFMKTYKPKLYIDACLSVSGVTLDLIKELSELEPFGQGNSQPKFLLNNVTTTFFNTVGEKHLQCVLSSEDGKKVKAIAFNCSDKIIEALKSHKRISVIGTIKKNEWNNTETLQFIIEDIIL